MREGVRVLDDPRHECRCQLGIEWHAELGKQEGHHLAGGGCVRLDPDRLAVARIADVVVDVHDAGARQPLRLFGGDGSDAAQLAGVDHHRHIRLECGRAPNAFHPRQEGEEGRRRVDAHHLRLLAEPLGGEHDRDPGTQGVAGRILVTEGGDALGAAQHLGDLEHYRSPASSSSS